MKINVIFYASIIIALCHYIVLYNQIYATAQEADSSDFTDLGGDVSSNAKLIADDIGLYNETEIKDYSLTDLPAEDVQAVLNILNIGNISKVLLNISEEELDNIKNKLTEEKFNNILKRLSVENQTKVIERINNN